MVAVIKLLVIAVAMTVGWVVVATTIVKVAMVVVAAVVIVGWGSVDSRGDMVVVLAATVVLVALATW